MGSANGEMFQIENVNNCPSSVMLDIRNSQLRVEAQTKILIEIRANIACWYNLYENRCIENGY